MAPDTPDILADERPWHDRLEEAGARSEEQARQQIALRQREALQRGLVSGALAVAAYAELSRLAPERRDLQAALDPAELEVSRDLARRLTQVAVGDLAVQIQDGAAPRVEIHPATGGAVLRLRAGAPRYGWLQQEAARCEVTGYVPGAWEEPFLAGAARAGEAILAAGLVRSRARQREIWGDLWQGESLVLPQASDAAAPLSDSLFDA